MSTKRILLVGMGALGVIAMAASARANHSTPNPPNSWNRMGWLDLVPAHNQCPPASGSIAHPAPFSPPNACTPPVPTSSALKFGPSGRGRIRFVKTSTPPNILVRVELSDVRDSSNNPFTGGNLTVRFVLRISDANCTASTHCTVVDFPFTFIAFTCAAGSCAINTSINASVPGSVVGGTAAVFEIRQLSIQDPSNVDFLRPGIFIP